MSSGRGQWGWEGLRGGAHRPSLCPQFLFVSLRRREATYQLLRSLCRHLQVGAVLGGGRALCPPHRAAALLVQDNTWSPPGMLRSNLEPPASPLNNSTKQSPRKSLVRERQQQQHSVAPGRAFWGKCGAEKSRPPCQTPLPPILQQSLSSCRPRATQTWSGAHRSLTVSWSCRVSGDPNVPPTTPHSPSRHPIALPSWGHPMHPTGSPRYSMNRSRLCADEPNPMPNRAEEDEEEEEEMAEDTPILGRGEQRPRQSHAVSVCPAQGRDSRLGHAAVPNTTRSWQGDPTQHCQPKAPRSCVPSTPSSCSICCCESPPHPPPLTPSPVSLHGARHCTVPRMVALLLTSGYIGLRILELEQQLAALGAWPELSVVQR